MEIHLTPEIVNDINNSIRDHVTLSDDPEIVKHNIQAVIQGRIGTKLGVYVEAQFINIDFVEMLGRYTWKVCLPKT